MRARALVGIAFCVGWGVIVRSPTAEANSPAPPYVVCFGVGSTAISASGAQQMEKAAAEVRRIGRRSRLEVYGRTDAVEARSQSTTLSADRGSVVKKRLVELGVPPDRIQVWAYANSGRLVLTESAEPLNRCATIEVKLNP